MGSTRKIVKLRETIENTSYTPPSPIKTTHTTIASNHNDVSTASVSNAGDVMMTSSSQKERILKKNSILTRKDPPEGRTTAKVAVMRGKPKHGHHRQCSNKHYKQKLVRVLLDSGSDGNLVLVNKDKPMLLPSLKRLVPQSWNTSNGMFQTKRKAEIDLNFFEYSDSKRCLAEPDIVEHDKNNKPQYDTKVDLIGPYTLKCKDGLSTDFMCLTMIDPATSWFEIVELPTVTQEMTVPPTGKGKKVTFNKNAKVTEPYFDKSSAQISNLVYKTWFSRYSRCRYMIYNNGSKFKLHFRSLCNTYGKKRKPTSVKNPQANAILEHIHAVLGNMLCTSELHMAKTMKASDIDVFLSDAAWAVCSTYHTPRPKSTVGGTSSFFSAIFFFPKKSRIPF